MRIEVFEDGTQNWKSDLTEAQKRELQDTPVTLESVTLENAEIAYAPAYASAFDAINQLGSLAGSVLNGSLKLIMPEELDLIREKAMLIDIREPKAFAQKHLDGAINLPLYAIRQNLDSIPHDKMVIVYCMHGRGSYHAAILLKNRGFDNVYMLSGGMKLYDLVHDTYFNKKG